MMATGLGPDSPWVFVIVAAMLGIVVLVERRRETRRRLYRAKLPTRPRCEVIGCAPRLSDVWLPEHELFACNRCAAELAELRRQLGGAA